MANAGAMHPLRTLAIDIGGSGLKMMTLGPFGEPLNERERRLTPKPATASAVLAVLEAMIAEQPPFGRIAAGFPGVVASGKTLTAVNLDPSWIGFDLGKALSEMAGVQTRVANDADIQGLAVIEGVGTEFVLTLGTGLGSALYVDGRLVPNLEIAHHVFRKNKTYEEHLGIAALHRLGKIRWNELLREAVDQLRITFNFHRLFIGGGNARKVREPIAEDVQLVSNRAGLLGCIHLWAPEVGQGKLLEGRSAKVVVAAAVAQ